MAITLHATVSEPQRRVFTLLRDGAPLSRGQLLQLFSADADEGLRALLTATLRAAPWPAFCWECPPVHAAADARPAAFVLVESPALARSVGDPSAFREAFASLPGPIVTFPNLGGDALLVSPRPGVAIDATHLAAFLRTAPDPAADALWRSVADAVGRARRADDRPRWLSTAGLGVSWLHVRVDTAPKYYRHRAWADPSA
jgi:hypothetical protein